MDVADRMGNLAAAFGRQCSSFRQHTGERNLASGSRIQAILSELTDIRDNAFGRYWSICRRSRAPSSPV
ncbi:MAG: hypothetical protein JWP89_5669 [Schlesneria sp.]|nr:hypothetical protein [Schlesneria sp.]